MFISLNNPVSHGQHSFKPGGQIPVVCYHHHGTPGLLTQFQKQVDAACVYWNAPTSFTDGAQFGLGAEIGISTQKLGPRGPMALEEMTTYKWIIEGDGQIRS